MFVIRQLQKDSEFLSKQNIMDYSLLLAVESIEVSPRESLQKSNNNFTDASPNSRRAKVIRDSYKEVQLHELES